MARTRNRCPARSLGQGRQERRDLRAGLRRRLPRNARRARDSRPAAVRRRGGREFGISVLPQRRRNGHGEEERKRVLAGKWVAVSEYSGGSRGSTKKQRK